MWPPDFDPVHAAVLLIDLIAALAIVGYVVAAMTSLVRGGSIVQARLLVAEGAVLGLSFKVAATLLKTLELHSWDQISLFAAVLALRTVLRQVFVREKQQVQRERAGNRAAPRIAPSK